MKYGLIYMLVINFVALILFAADKQRARQQKWRIPENTLLLCSAIGGSIGVLLGMYLFHHKTKKVKFYLGVPVIIVLQLTILYFIF